MSKEKFEITPEKIRCLQELSEGWKTIWEHISEELLSSTVDKNDNGVITTGRLISIARRFSRSSYDVNSTMPEFDIDDFVSFVYERYYQEVLQQTLFLDYDSEQYGCKVFDYLCSKRILKQMFSRYKKQNTLIKTPRTKTAHPRPIQYDEPPKKYDKEKKGFAIASVEDDKLQAKPYFDERNPFTVFLQEKLILTISPTAKGTFYSRDIHAGLQLYSHIDYADQNMLKLQENVHKSVADSDTNKSYDKPQTKIEKEHKIAIERIDEKINAIDDVIYDIKKQKRRHINLTATEKADRKIFKYSLQKFFRPLDALQIVDLLGFNRASADQTIKRYYEFVTEILPLSEDAKEKFRPWFLTQFQNEKGENND
jgi:hypothetical protein